MLPVQVWLTMMQRAVQAACASPAGTTKATIRSARALMDFTCPTFPSANYSHTMTVRTVQSPLVHRIR